MGADGDAISGTLFLLVASSLSAGEQLVEVSHDALGREDHEQDDDRAEDDPEASPRPLNFKDPSPIPKEDKADAS